MKYQRNRELFDVIPNLGKLKSLILTFNDIVKFSDGILSMRRQLYDLTHLYMDEVDEVQ